MFDGFFLLLLVLNLTIGGAGYFLYVHIVLPSLRYCRVLSGEAATSQKQKRIGFSLGLLVFVAFAEPIFGWQRFIGLPEILEVHVDEAIVIPLATDSYEDSDGPSWVLKAGKKLKVLHCLHDNAISAVAVEIDDERWGYLSSLKARHPRRLGRASDAKFRFVRRPATVSDLFETPLRYLVTTCHDVQKNHFFQE